MHAERLQRREAPSSSSWVTKSDAKVKFLLSDGDLVDIVPKEVSNPKNKHFSTMKLYPLQEVRQAALRKWGAWEALEKEKVKRLKKKAKSLTSASASPPTGTSKQQPASTLSGKLLGIQLSSEPTQAVTLFSYGSTRHDATSSAPAGKMGKKGPAAAGADTDSTSPRKRQKVKAAGPCKQHEFGQEARVSGDLFKKVCKHCGFQMEFEKL